MTLITKLEIIGHVHDDATRTVMQSFSAPLGMTEEEVDIIIDRFSAAFILVSIKTIPDGHVHTPRNANTAMMQFAGGSFFSVSA